MSDPDLTPAEEQVRRLLADARHDEPLPDDVADRLDRVLDDLRRTPGPGVAPPVDLAARRRRRVARNLLVAAAAVVVLGVGISRIDLSVEGSADSSSAGSADDAPAAESMPSETSGGSDLEREAGPPVELRSEDFDQQVTRLQSTRGGLDALADTVEEQATGELEHDAGAARSWCDDGAWGAGRRIAVRYDGERGVLVLRRPVDGMREVDLFLCGDTVPSRSVTVPAG